MDVAGEWDRDVFDQYDEWDDCWTILGDEADELAVQVERWKRELERDLREWNVGYVADPVAG